ncbi:MAG TPA: FliH/SctL family protein [Pyrinomonadaceae bacterium]|nr:FliH/SctL family protein [Pyrinomonadaceae bacterium]
MSNENSGNLIKASGRKASESFPVRQKVIKNQIVSAREEAARIIEEAEEFAAELRREAREDAEKLRSEAYRAGTETALAEFENISLEMNEIRERVWRETEKDLLRLAVRLAEKIVGREIKKDSKTVVDIVSAALQNARQQEKLTVRVNPADLLTVEAEMERFSSATRVRYLDFIADPRVSIGGCLIESEVGTIDARLETQLRVLERALVSQSEGEERFE